MGGIVKWGLIILGVYLLWRWWQSQQVTAQPAWTPGLTGAVFGGGTINPPSGVGPPYAPYSTMPPADTIYGSGNPGYIKARAVGPAPVLGGIRFVQAGSYMDNSNAHVTDPVNYLGLIARPVGPTPPFGTASY